MTDSPLDLADTAFADAVLDAAPVIVLVLDARGKVLHYNAFMERLCGRPIAETRGLDWFAEFLLDGERESVRAFFEQTRQDPVEANINAIRCRGGESRLIEWYDRKLRRCGEISRVVAVGVDITERVRAAAERRELASRLEQLGRVFSLFEAAIDEVFVLLSPELDRVLYISESVERALGFDRSRAYADIHAMLDLLHPDDRASMTKTIGRWRIDETSEFRVLTPEGATRWFESRLRKLGPESPLPGAHVAIAIDVTARHESEEAMRGLTEQLEARVAERTASLEHERGCLQNLLIEKEALLYEVHHRVKNNLQVVVSLLYLEGVDASLEVREVLDECSARVRSMALIHEHLYLSGQLATIDLVEFLAKLADELTRVFAGHQQIRIRVTGGGLRLTIERAVPVALLVNELLTNALKYAYPSLSPGQSAEVRVHVQPDSIEITDDGVGIEIGRDGEPAAANSLGLRLVHALARQLDARFGFEAAPGTRARLELCRRGD